MKTTHLRRSLAVVATTLACLAVMATPAAATPHGVDLTDGLLEFAKAGVYETIDLSSPTCSPAPTLELDVTGTAVSITDVSVTSHFPDANVLTVVTPSAIGNTSGTLSGTAITPLRVALTMTLYGTTGCTPTGTPLCTLGVLLGLSGTLSGTTASDAVSLHGQSVGNVVALGGCAFGLTFLVGTTLVISPFPGFVLTGHLTS